MEAMSVYGHWVGERAAKVVAEAMQGWPATASSAVFPSSHESRGRAVLVLPETQGPGSVGAVPRLADTCGAGSVFTGEQSVNVSSPKVIRALVGSVLYVSTPYFLDLAQLASASHES